MENKDRIKALNILFTATWISIVVTAILAILSAIIGNYYFNNPEADRVAIIIGPITTYIIGRILCFKEYK